MKEVFLSFIIILLSTVAINAQLLKEGSCVTNDELMRVTKYGIGDNEGGNILQSNVEKYYILNNNQTVTFYNLDCSIYKIVKINYPQGQQYSVPQYVTTNLFNNDDLIEFIYSYTDPISLQNHTYLINENGVVLYDFNDESIASIFSTPSGQLKLLTSKYDKSTQTLINTTYSLSAFLPSSVNPIHIVQNIPYPNPSKNIVNLPYQLEQGKQATMNIYNINGKQITTKQIDSSFDKIRLDVSGYTKGMYVYEYNGKKGKFLVE